MIIIPPALNVSTKTNNILYFGFLTYTFRSRYQKFPSIFPGFYSHHWSVLCSIVGLQSPVLISHRIVISHRNFAQQRIASSQHNVQVREHDIHSFDISKSVRLSADYGVKSIDFTPQSADDLTNQNIKDSSTSKKINLSSTLPLVLQLQLSQILSMKKVY